MYNWRPWGKKWGTEKIFEEIMGSIHWEDLTILKVYASNNRALKYVKWDLPGGAVVKNPPANAGDMGSSPGPGRSHMPRSI